MKKTGIGLMLASLLLLIAAAIWYWRNQVTSANSSQVTQEPAAAASSPKEAFALALGQSPSATCTALLYGSLQSLRMADEDVGMVEEELGKDNPETAEMLKRAGPARAYLFQQTALHAELVKILDTAPDDQIDDFFETAADQLRSVFEKFNSSFYADCEKAYVDLFLSCEKESRDSEMLRQCVTSREQSDPAIAQVAESI